MHSSVSLQYLSDEQLTASYRLGLKRLRSKILNLRWQRVTEKNIVYFADFLLSDCFPELIVQYIWQIFSQIACRFSIRREYSLRVKFFILIMQTGEYSRNVLSYPPPPSPSRPPALSKCAPILLHPPTK
jgi:hypothetical protein